MTSRDWRSTLLSSLLSALAVCCGVLSMVQSPAPVAATSAGSHQWTTSEPVVSGISPDRVPEWARTAPESPQLSAAVPDGAGDSDDDDDGDNDDAPGAAVATAPATLTADRGHTQLAAPQEIGRRLASASDGHSLRAPPQ